MEHCELLTEILKIEQARFVGMYTSNCDKITDGVKPGVLTHLSNDEMLNSIRYDMRRWETYKMFHNQLGDTKYAMVRYEKAILLTFSLDNGEFLRVSIEPEADYKSIIDQIQETIVKNHFLH